MITGSYYLTRLGVQLERRFALFMWGFRRCQFSSAKNNADWLQEEERMGSLVPEFSESCQNVKTQFYPSAIREWKRVYDREAGDDDEDIFRAKLPVKDTHLFKGVLPGGRFLTIKTASAESLITLIESNIGNADLNFWEHVFSRIEYISSTLSVKKIRLMLLSMSKTPDLATIVEPEELLRLVHLLGEEVLCRYHSMTLLTCASIAQSLSILRCRDAGTLNVLVVCFKQILQEDNHSLPDSAIVEYAGIMQTAFVDLKYHVDVLDEVMTTVSKLRKAECIPIH